MQTILLYGFLGRQFGKVHHYDVRSPAEAVRALSVTLAGFRKAVADGGSYRVLVGGKTALSVETLGHPVSSRETIRIVPAVEGAGRGGVLQLILGIALIIAAPYLPVGYGITAGTFTSIGFSLALGGVSQMLFAPKPAQNGTSTSGSVDRPENRPSYTFDGAVNTAAQGNPVPVLYGKLIVGSQVISAGLSVEQI